MNVKLLYLLIAALGVAVLAYIVLGLSKQDSPKPAVPAGMTQSQADEYRNAARRTGSQKSAPSTYQWTPVEQKPASTPK